MDEIVEIAHHSGRLAGKVANTIEKTVVENHLNEKLKESTANATALISDQYLKQTGHHITTDLKIAGVMGGTAVGMAAASVIPTVIVAGAVGTAALGVATQSELAQKAKSIYEEQLGRNIADDKESLIHLTKAGFNTAKAATVAAVHGYKEIRKVEPGS